jgi:hypothetical protein
VTPGKEQDDTFWAPTIGESKTTMASSIAVLQAMFKIWRWEAAKVVLQLRDSFVVENCPFNTRMQLTCC